MLGALVSTVDCWMCVWGVCALVSIVNCRMCVWGVCAWCFGEYCKLSNVCMGSMCLVLW